MKFFKMHAQGNDYVFFDRRASGLPDVNPAQLARAVSNRHTGVGSDGIVMLLPADEPGVNAAFRMWNADGSEAETCGSALRCVTAYLAALGGPARVTLRTVAGLRAGAVNGANIAVGMGRVEELHPLEQGVFVRVGNPHLVLWRQRLDHAEVLGLGPQLERSIPGGVNVHFVHVLDDSTLEMETWERGSGFTLACGSGACASVAAAWQAGLAHGRTEARQPGGSVWVSPQDGELLLEGPVQHVFDGELNDTGER